MIFRWRKNTPKQAASSTRNAEQEGNNEEGAGPLLAFVMTRNTQAPSPDRLLTALKKRLPALEIQPEDQTPDGPLTFLFDGLVCAIMPIDQPNPLSAEDSSIQSAWWWPEAMTDLAERRAHSIVTVMGSNDARTGLELLSRLCAAVIEVNDAIGVTWDTADAVWQAELFRDVVDNDAPFPFQFSVKLNRDTEFPRSDGNAAWLGMTYGLAAFGLMEIEVRGFDADEPAEMLQTMHNIGIYLLGAGPVIGHGDTVGPDDHTKITVRHEPSTLNPGAMVYRLYLQSSSLH